MHSPVNKFLLKVSKSDISAVLMNVVLVLLLQILNRYFPTGEYMVGILSVEHWVYKISL